MRRRKSLDGRGISKMGELIDLGVKANVVEKSGSWFSYGSERIGQGRENAKRFLLENPETAAAIEAAVRKNAGILDQALMGSPEEDGAGLDD